jgi:hypothetical protein
LFLSALKASERFWEFFTVIRNKNTQRANCKEGAQFSELCVDPHKIGCWARSSGGSDEHAFSTTFVSAVDASDEESCRLDASAHLLLVAGSRFHS